MSTSQRVPLRRVRCLSQKPGGDVRVHQPPPEITAESNFPAHHPSLEANGRDDSVLLSHSAMTSMTRLQTPLNTARASVVIDMPLCCSPPMSMRDGTTFKTASIGATVEIASPRSAVVSDERAQRVDETVSGESGAACGRHGGPTAAGATAEKVVPKRLSDGSGSSAMLRMPASGERRQEECQLRPTEECLSFEIYSCSMWNLNNRSANRPNSTIGDPRIVPCSLGNACRTSPMAPSILPMVVVPDSFSQRNAMSTSLGDPQQNGRYAAMSQSSRSEEAHLLALRPIDGEEFFAVGSVPPHPHGSLLDDIVRNSATDSFQVDAVFGSSAQPLRVDSSVSSPNLKRSNVHLHPASNTSGLGCGAANGRYTSTSTCSPPQISAEVTAVSAGGSDCLGPEVFSSDQLAHIPTVQLKQRSRNTTAAVTGAGGDTPCGRQGTKLLARHSSDFFAPSGAAHTDEGPLSPSKDDFSIVRAPVTGLRARVLGNSAVDEEEAAEDPEALELLTKQMQNFASKIARHLRDGSGVSTQQRLVLLPGDSPVVAPAQETKAEVIRRANAAAVKEEEVQSERAGGKEACAATSPSNVSPKMPPADTTDTGNTCCYLTASEEVKRSAPKTAGKHVRFNLEGLALRDEEGPNALQMPRHGGVQHNCEPLVCPLSLPSLLNSDASGTGSCAVPVGIAEQTSAKRHHSPKVVDVRSVLRAGVTGQCVPLFSDAIAEEAVESTEGSEVVLLPCMTSSVVVECPLVSDSPSGSAVGVLLNSRNDSDCQKQLTEVVPEALSTAATAHGTASTNAALMPSPLAAIPHFTYSAQEPQKKRKPAGKIRRSTKTHRRSVAATVAGSNASVTVSRCRSSLTSRPLQLTPLNQQQETLLSSVEVRPPENAQQPYCVSISSPNLRASSTTKIGLFSTPTGTGAGGLASPKRGASVVDAVRPNHRIDLHDLWKNNCTSIAAAAPITSLTASTPPRSLCVTQVNQSQRDSGMLINAAAAAPPSPSSKDGEAKKPCGAARRNAVGTLPSPTGAAGVATAPSSRRSSLSLACAPALKAGTYAELPPLSVTQRSPNVTPGAAVQHHLVTPSPSVVDPEAAVFVGIDNGMLPPALAYRSSTSHGTRDSSYDISEVGVSDGAGSALEMPPACFDSNVQYKGYCEEAAVPANCGGGSHTPEPSLNVNADNRVQVVPQNVHVLPRLSTSSTRLRTS
ncbi:hypothetical protein ABL78_6973 [Leptomonas seymouri]|uniref:Uncharacterized protein n=1 Tax=Leptomonas seymouri TaxID=5684 RepID=A0A0N1HT15_LEPSE|nr:hypothetical protein ABL78_6973 [Leptomonas seymouri]|eukprot:KPI83981.1 hypothetical protein ABL78_6973 [Leptomonas seymouri]